MKIRTRNSIVNFSFIIVLVYFLGISLFVDFLHKPNEDLTKCHDDCPACNWVRQLQVTNYTTSTVQICDQLHQSFVRLSILPDECPSFQSIIFTTLLSRAPPIA